MRKNFATSETPRCRFSDASNCFARFRLSRLSASNSRGSCKRLGTMRGERSKKVMADQISVHVALNVSRFEESVKFYRAMFGVEPVKWKPNYAKFDIAEPPLNLTLNYEGEVKHQGALNHLGIEVPSTAEVLAAKERLQNIGLVTTDEMNVEC